MNSTEYSSSQLDRILPHRFVTSIKHGERNYYLTGQGRQLVIFKSSELEKYARYEVFPSDAIHGLDFYKSIVCFYGVRSFRIGRFFEDSQNELNISFLTETCNINDWICSAKVLLRNKILLVTARNVAMVYNVELEQHQYIQCSKQCISYCSRIFGMHDNELFIVNGNAFKQIFIWSPYYSNGNPLKIFNAHDGAVFDIDYSLNNQLLCSVSDDRSCRLWKLHHFSLVSGQYPSWRQWESCEIILTHILQEHHARVWRTCFANDRIITAGEDGIVCLWKQNGELVSRTETKKGNLRALHYDAESEKAILGSDSGACFSLSLRSSSVVHYQLNSFADSDILKTVHITSVEPSSLLCISSSGNVYHFHKNSKRLLLTDNNLRSCSVDQWKENGLIVFGGLSGSLYLFNEGDLHDCSGVLQCQKYFSLHLIDNGNILLACIEQGRMHLFDVSNKREAKLIRNELTLPNGRQRWPSAAMLVQSSSGCFLAVGDRNGSVHFFPFNKEQSIISQPMYSYFRIHGSHGVTAFMLLNGIFYSTGRDGSVNTWNIEKLNEKPAHERACRGMEWPSRFIVFNQRQLIVGFHADHFRVFDFNSGEMLSEIHCGGGHRSYDLIVQEQRCFSTLNFHFAFIKRGQVEILNWQPQINCIQRGAHVRRITDLCFISRTMFVSCSDDTSLCLWNLDKNGHLSLVRRYHLHISAVFSIRFCENLLVSAGGRGQLCCWSVLKQQGLRPCGSMKDESDFRYVAVDHMPMKMTNGENQYLILAARCDGYVKAFLWNENDAKVTDRSDRLMLPCNSFVASMKLVNRDDSEQHAICAVACTNGQLYVRQVNTGSEFFIGHEQKEWHLKVLVEKCGLSSIQCRQHYGAAFWLAIGAESGNLFTTTIQLFQNQNQDEVDFKKLIPPSLSTVTSLCSISESVLLSISTDERLYLWHACMEMDFHLCYAQFIDIADPLAICAQIIAHTVLVCIAGQGLQFFAFPSNTLCCYNCAKNETKINYSGRILYSGNERQKKRNDPNNTRQGLLIGDYIKEQNAILKVIPICYPPVGCKYMKNPAILAVMYNHSLQKVCNGNLTPSYEYTVKLMAIALYERHMEDIDKYKNRRTLGLPMPSWATTKYKIKEDKWKNDLIVELNKLSFSDRFQAMEEYLKVAQNADIYGHEMFYMDDKHSSFLDIDSHGIKICGIFDKDNYFQWQQVKFIRGEKNNVFLRLNAPNNTSLLTLKIPFKDSEDANAFISYCLTVLCLRCAESTFNNFMIKEKTEKKYRALIDEYLTTIYLPDCSLTAETTQCTDNLPMDEEHSADNNDEYESEYTSGSYIIEDENQHEYQVQEDGEEEEKDDDDDDEESNEEDDGFEEDEDDYIEYEKHNEYREYDNKSEILLGEEEEAGTKEECKKQYVENNSKPREAISDLKYESTMNDQVETLYQEKLMVPFDNELSQGALQNLIIKCINEDELIKSIKHKLKFVETNLDDKYDLDVKIEITATLMSEELYKTAQDKNYAKENKDNNSEEKETAI
ncbi:WD repeat-containing protein 6 [Trichinella pseudospiralis]|uniref:tRNA (34-2'-O)-methyltransferase regulator WDR6 n=1 Tax=Trichinella pseudospiralis TaxID=6337 RepID=A0A0V1FC65_TRIPS|nr:WD repeat-containing protein 6 [Trichinella pseudospiralis]